MNRLKKYVKWLVCAVVGLAICVTVVLKERAENGTYDLFHLLSDGCYVAGVALAGVGALVWISSVGGFSALGYAVYLIKRKKFSSNAKFEARLSYLDYKLSYGEKKKGFSCMLISGLIFIAAAGVFLILHMQ